MANRNLEKMASIDAQLRQLVPAKVSEDDKLVEYDALLLDRFLDILQDLHGHALLLDRFLDILQDLHGEDLRETVVRERERMTDHSENLNSKMVSPLVDRPFRLFTDSICDLLHVGDTRSLKQAKKLWVKQVIPNARRAIDQEFLHFLDKSHIDYELCDALPYLSVADKMDVAKLHDSDDKKEEEAVLPGFKLHPTDEELVAFYLRRQVEKKPHLVERIKENIDIYKYDPWNHLNYAFQENSISLKSSDNMVLKMNKRAATSQSKVLRDVVDSTGGLDEIPVPGVTGLILSKITPFCKKIHKFDTQLNIITELLKCTMDSYKACVTSFVKDNQSIFSQLHDAANYLNIPNLMELTSRTMRDMKKGSTTEEISDRYSTLSIARILSPLGLSLRYSS